MEIDAAEDFQLVMNRLQAFFGVDSNKAVGERLGLKASNIGERKSRGALPRKQIDALCAEHQLNPEWVYEGRGEMRLGAQASALQVLSDAAAAVRALSLDDTSARQLQDLLTNVGMGNREKVLPMVKGMGFQVPQRKGLKARTGSGAITSVADETVVDVMAFDREWLRKIGVSPEQLSVIAVRGDSMADTLQDGDLILVDTSLAERNQPGVYVIVKNDRLLVKRLHFKMSGQVVISSDNKAYQPETLSAAEFEHLQLVGRMVRRVVR